MSIMIDRLLDTARRFIRDFSKCERGNVAMMFGIALVPMVIAAGAGLDYARSALVKSQMADALDAAALAVGSTTGLNTSTAQTLAQKYFTANYVGDTSNGTPAVTVTNYNTTTGTVTITASYNLPTTLLRVIGQNQVAVTDSSTVVWGQSKLWVALVLDNTGSMCEPDSSPCDNDTNSGIKINALKTASIQLLGILQNAASNPGDVKVSIVPFDQDVNWGTGMVSSSWVSWTDWASAPANVSIASNVGPGDACPFTTSSNKQMSPYGFYCVASSTNGDPTVSTIPSGGQICPGEDSGTYNSGRVGRYYNGCYNSVPSNASVNGTTTTKNVCTNSSNCTTASYCGGYPSTATTTSGHASTTTTNTCACNTTTSPKKTCTITSKPVTTTTTYSHTWNVNGHSTWKGCIMDRDQDADETDSASNTAGYPAVNSDSNYDCPPATVTALSYDWTALQNQINAMIAGGGTNQTIGLANGMETLSPAGPFPAGALPTNTTRYMIILSDGLNTIDRWYGNGSSQSSQVDGRMAQACTNAKAEGIVVYSIFVNLGSSGNSTVLQNCATDSTKYYALTTSGAIITTFNQIAQQITNVRVSR